MMRIAPIACLLFAWPATLHAETLVAVAGALSGPYATLGKLMRLGAEQAVRDINQAGGVNGEALKIEAFDDACDAAKATAIANQIAGKGARFVVGHLCSSTSIAAAAVYAQHSIVQISPASSNPKLTDERAAEMVFRLFHRSDQQALTAADHIRRNFANSKIAIVHDDTAYGKGLAEDLRQHLSSSGLTEVLFQAYQIADKNQSSIVATIKGAAPDLVYIGGGHQEAAAIVRGLRDAGVRAAVMSGDALVNDEFWTIAGVAAEGTLVTFPPDPRDNPSAAAVVERFRTSGVEPEGYVLQAYAAVQTWAMAASEAGSTDGQQVAAALSTGQFETALGTVSFDAKGDVNLPGFVVYVWRTGDLKQAE